MPEPASPEVAPPPAHAPAPNPPAPASDLDARFRAAEKNVELNQKAVEDDTRRRQQDDRSLIAKLIVYAFVVLIGTVVVLVAAGTAASGWDKWIEPAKFFLNVLSSVLLPVVTLVIGYYFGKEK